MKFDNKTCKYEWRAIRSLIIKPNWDKLSQPDGAYSWIPDHRNRRVYNCSKKEDIPRRQRWHANILDGPQHEITVTRWNNKECLGDEAVAVLNYFATHLPDFDTLYETLKIKEVAAKKKKQSSSKKEGIKERQAGRFKIKEQREAAADIVLLSINKLLEDNGIDIQLSTGEYCTHNGDLRLEIKKGYLQQAFNNHLGKDSTDKTGQSLLKGIGEVGFDTKEVLETLITYGTKAESKRFAVLFGENTAALGMIEQDDLVRRAAKLKQIKEKAEEELKAMGQGIMAPQQEEDNETGT